MSHVVNYGSSVFEGFAAMRCRADRRFSGDRAHAAPDRLGAHLPIDVAFIGPDRERSGRTGETQRRLALLYPPIVLRGYGEAGVNPFNSPTEVYICNYPWGNIWGRRQRRRGCLHLFVDADRTEHFAGDGQSGRELHELAAHQDGGDR